MENTLSRVRALPRMSRLRIVSGGPVGAQGVAQVGAVWFVGHEVIHRLPRTVANSSSVSGFLVESFGTQSDHFSLADHVTNAGCTHAG